MPVNAGDARSYRALIPFAMLNLPAANPDGSMGTMVFKNSKLGTLPIMEIIYSAETVAPIFEAVMEAVVSGRAKDRASFAAVLQETIGTDNIAGFVQKIMREAPETLFRLLLGGMWEHLSFSPDDAGDGNSKSDFMDYVRSLGPDTLVDWLFFFMQLNFPGGYGPFVEAWKRFQDKLPKPPATVAAPPPAPRPSSGPVSGTRSTTPPPALSVPVGPAPTPSPSVQATSSTTMDSASSNGTAS